MPPNPPSNAHGFAMRGMSLGDMQIPKSEKKFLAPPLPNPGDAPVQPLISKTVRHTDLETYSNLLLSLVYNISNKMDLS